MAVTDKRAELASTLSTITGITGYEFRPATPKSGSAWVLLESLERGPADFFAGIWRVILVLSGDEKTAQKNLDAWLPDVTATLDPVAFVQSVNPAIVQTDSGDYFAAEIRVRSE